MVGRVQRPRQLPSRYLFNVYVLENPLRRYAWGSRTHIPQLVGFPPTTEPVAEMWLGAHPSNPSMLEDGRPLDVAITQDPLGLLGPEVEQSFGHRLPFLMKLLAAAEPLSLQVHPSTQRAHVRFAQEDAAGIPLTSPSRSYRDRSHKPELIYALTRFEGMAGFRDPLKSARILRGLELTWSDAIAAELESTKAAFQTHRSIVTRMLALRGALLAHRLAELRDSAARAAAQVHRPQPQRRPPAVDPHDVSREARRVYEAVVKLIDRYPDDPGVLVTLLLNHVVLAAGEAMHVSAGVIHAYTSGFGLEIMASSDNVVRAGLTPKHVDKAELLAITDFTPTPPPVWLASPTDQRGVSVFQPPVEEFELVIFDSPSDADVNYPGPRIVLALSGEVTLEQGDAVRTLRPGAAVFIGNGERDIVLHGAGRLALGRVPARERL